MSGVVNDPKGMFAPLRDDELRASERAAPADKKEDSRPIIPVPVDAPEPDWSRLLPVDAVGDPVGIWTYLTADGEIAFYVARWKSKDPNKPKVIRPVTWCRFPDGSKGWALKAMPAARPLYNLPAILVAPAKAVVVVEGEKCADAAAHVFLDHAVTTWAGGSRAWKLSDWQPLSGRDVLLVADADERGREAMRGVAAHLTSMGCLVRVSLPDGDDKDDIADWLDSDGPERTRERIEAEPELWQREVSVMPDANENANWIIELVERSKTDPGAPFERDTQTKLQHLQRIEPADWERLRAALRDEAKIRVGTLDQALARLPGDDDCSSAQGQPWDWPEIVPWPTRVDGAALLDDVSSLIGSYVEMTRAQADATALWNFHTWLHDRLDLSTFLNITSATKRCGKSLLLEVLEELVHRPLLLSGRITSPGMFRIVELCEPTLLLDESDTYLRDDDELRGFINGSQRKSGARTMRTVKVGDSFTMESFKTWCPKVIAGIGGLPDTVLDRSIVIRLERRAPSTRDMPRWRDRDRAAIGAIQRRLARWIADNVEVVLQRRNAVTFPSGTHDRARDAWEALLAIGEFAGGNWAGTTGRAYRACEAIHAEVDPETGACEMLLTDMRKVFEEAGNPEVLPTGKRDEQYYPNEPAILPALIAMEGRPWSEWSHGRPLSPRGLANLLKGFGIAPGTIRLNHKLTAKGYKRASFEPIWERYGVSNPEGSRKLSVTPSQPRLSAGFSDCTSVTSPDSVTDGNRPNPTVRAGCDVVTDGSSTATYENADNRDPNPLDDMVADAHERAAILEFEGEVPKADAERMAERQCGLEPSTLVNGKRGCDGT